MVKYANYRGDDSSSRSHDTREAGDIRAIAYLEWRRVKHLVKVATRWLYNISCFSRENAAWKAQMNRENRRVQKCNYRLNSHKFMSLVEIYGTIQLQLGQSARLVLSGTDIRNEYLIILNLICLSLCFIFFKTNKQLFLIKKIE